MRQPWKRFPLPRGWSQASTDRGEVFFVNHITRATTWVDPRMMALIPASLREDLPPGWEVNFDDDGDLFFIDHSTETTHRRPEWLSPDRELPSLNPAHFIARDLLRDQDDQERSSVSSSSPSASPPRFASASSPHRSSPLRSTPSPRSSPPRYDANHHFQQTLEEQCHMQQHMRGPRGSRLPRPGLVRHTLAAAAAAAASVAGESVCGSTTSLATRSRSSSSSSLYPSSASASASMDASSTSFVPSAPSSPTLGSPPRPGSPPSLVSRLAPAHSYHKETTPPYLRHAQVHTFETDAMSRSASSSASFDMDLDEGCASTPSSSSASFTSSPPRPRRGNYDRSRRVRFDERVASPKKYDSGFSETSEDELPEGWRCHRTSQGQAYYVHNTSKRATWIDPRICYEFGVDLSKMPPHWDVGVDNHGLYFIDHKRKETYREIPHIAELEHVHIVDLSSAATDDAAVSRHSQASSARKLDHPYSSASSHRPPSPPPPRYWSLKSSFHSLGDTLRRTFGFLSSFFSFLSTSTSTSSSSSSNSNSSTGQPLGASPTSHSNTAPQPSALQLFSNSSSSSSNSHSMKDIIIISNSNSSSSSLSSTNTGSQSTSVAIPVPPSPSSTPQAHHTVHHARSASPLSLQDLEAPGLPPLMRRVTDYVSQSLGSFRGWYFTSASSPPSATRPQTLLTGAPLSSSSAELLV